MNEIIKRIQCASHIVVIAHVNPDADSLGSASAIYTYLLQKHKKVSFFCKTKEINKKFSFLPWFEKMRDCFPSSADLAISLDCGSYSRIGVSLECDLINIDHHQSNTEFGELNLVDVDCISTTQVIYNFFKTNEILINKKMSTALYAGLLDDSNGFLSPEIDGTTFAMSKELIECGANFHTCNTFVMKHQSLAGLRLKAIMLNKMQLIHHGEVAVFLITQDDLKKTGALGGDCESALEESLYLQTVKVSLLLKENKDLSLKGSLRSKGNHSILNIAATFDGGGHKNRAGFKLDNSYTLLDASKKIIKMIQKEI